MRGAHFPEAAAARPFDLLQLLEDTSGWGSGGRLISRRLLEEVDAFFGLRGRIYQQRSSGASG